MSFHPQLPDLRFQRDLHKLALGRLIERRKASEERARLIKSIERKGIEWALTFDAIESPIFLAANDGTVVRMNRAARDLAGGTYTSILGRRVGALGEGEIWCALDDLVRVVVETRESCAARAMDAAEQHVSIS
jgi:PAS domain-containing protein